MTNVARAGLSTSFARYKPLSAQPIRLSARRWPEGSTSALCSAVSPTWSSTAACRARLRQVLPSVSTSSTGVRKPDHTGTADTGAVTARLEKRGSGGKQTKHQARQGQNGDHSSMNQRVHEEIQIFPE